MTEQSGLQYFRNKRYHRLGEIRGVIFPQLEPDDSPQVFPSKEVIAKDERYAAEGYFRKPDPLESPPGSWQRLITFYGVDHDIKIELAGMNDWGEIGWDIQRFRLFQSNQCFVFDGALSGIEPLDGGGSEVSIKLTGAFKQRKVKGEKQ